MNCIEKFYEIYRQDPEAISFCPYRICPIGAHSDHQYGKVTGFAIDKGVSIAYKPKQNGVIELCSLQFDKRAQWHVRAVPDTKQSDWADYLRGITLYLSDIVPLKVGLCGVIEGSLPIGGLSSSAAVCLSFLAALCKVNDISLTPEEMIEISLQAENRYVGVSCGKLDQSCEVYCRKGNLLYLDTMDQSYELIGQSPSMKPYKIAIFFSGLERSLASSAFNTRVDECRAAGYALKAFAGMEYGKIAETHLREIPVDEYIRYRDLLPEVWKKRTEHFYTEFIRVEKGVEAWRKGDIDNFGKCIFESGRSSIENWESGCPELKKMYEIMTRTDGIYGGRFSGAGFKGCSMAIIDPRFEESILETMKREYCAAFPELKDRYSSYVCSSSDGINL